MPFLHSELAAGKLLGASGNVFSIQKIPFNSLSLPREACLDSVKEDPFQFLSSVFSVVKNILFT